MEVKVTDIQLEASWKEALSEEFNQPYFAAIKEYLVKQKEAGKVVYPKGSMIFNAFNKTPFNDVKAVVIGQDPYHGPDQAMGLSFSVPRGMRVPPSLRNVYKELHNDVGFTIPKHGDLTKWAEQGVFLLNAMLTVEHKKAGSHRKIGWDKFTDAVIKKLSDEQEGIAFLLWGNFAKNKATLIDGSKHLILKAAHPSPMAGNAFMNNKHFSQTNAFLEKQGKTPIDWELD